MTHERSGRSACPHGLSPAASAGKRSYKVWWLLAAWDDNVVYLSAAKKFSEMAAPITCGSNDISMLIYFMFHIFFVFLVSLLGRSFARELKIVAKWEDAPCRS